MVSVSRRAGPAHFGQFTFFQVGMMIERITRFVEGDVLRQCDRQVVFRDRHHAAFLAVDDGDWTAPIALTRNSPIAQPVIHLALSDRTIAARFLFKPFGYLFFRLFDRHSVEEARINHRAVAIIGNVGDDERLRVLAGRANHRRIAKSILVDEIEVTLIVRRAAEDRARSVIHQNEIRDIDRQRPVPIKRMDRPSCRYRNRASQPFLFRPAPCPCDGTAR